MEKKAFERPKLGVFYLVPDPKTNKYTIYSEYDEDENEAVHLNLWDSIVSLLKRRYRDKNVDIFEDNYRGLPRGRVMETGENQWIIAWGEDFPNEYKSDIISDFHLGDAQSINKVRWEFQNHETMQANDKKAVEKVLGITISPEGFKQTADSEKIVKEVMKKGQ
jgi:hypothetical protein